MIKTKKINIIELSDWDKLVESTYNKIYSFQQQEGGQSRGTIYLTVPDKTYEEDMNDSIPEVINDKRNMGVKFNVGLQRDSNAPLNPTDEELSKCSYYWGESELDASEFKNNKSNVLLFWERNFYPNLQTVANDLHKKGLLETGDYGIHIDW